jgi:hypothetical protein
VVRAFRDYCHDAGPRLPPFFLELLRPTWVEISIFAGTIAVCSSFATLYSPVWHLLLP